MSVDVKWSDLQRDPKSVATLAEQNQVRVSRRNGVPLILAREDSLAAADEGVIAGARTLRGMLQVSPAAVSAALLEVFPWVEFLPEAEQGQFATEFVHTFAACAELEVWPRLGDLLHAWKSTATIYADPYLLNKLTEPIDEPDLGSVSPPSQVV